MITNERQYKITRSEAEKFKGALAGFEASAAERANVHPRLLRAEREALVSQLEDLQVELESYEALQDAEAPVIEIHDFSGLAEGLIKARIAAGLSQKDLADRLGLKPQQIQRYEAERYEGASLKRLMQVIDALGVRISNDILVPYQAANFSGLEKKVAQVGLDSDFLSSRLMSSKDLAVYDGSVKLSGAQPESSIGRVSEILDRVYGWSADHLFGAAPLSAPRMAAAEARFKMPSGRKQTDTTVYATYAHYIAMIVLAAMPKDEAIGKIPDDPEVMHDAIMESYGEISLESALHYAWDLGIAVLPLRDGGTFHGACWRYQGRNVVVLKQRSKHLSRWLFDLLHELYHASQHADELSFEVIESDENAPDRRESDEEIMASQFAGEVVLGGRAEELAELCVSRAQGRIQLLKGVVPTVARQQNVDVGGLANYLAFRLSWQNINWWGAAANLQMHDGDPWLVARDVFFERFAFAVDDSLDRGLLERALEKG